MFCEKLKKKLHFTCDFFILSGTIYNNFLGCLPGVTWKSFTDFLLSLQVYLKKIKETKTNQKEHKKEKRK